MKTPAKVLLLVIAALGATALMAHLFWPTGLPGLLDRFAAPERAAPPAAREPAPAPAAGSVPSVREADAVYDAGEFQKAIDLYLDARTEGDDQDRERAQRGLEKAVLAWALTSNAPLPTPLPDDPDAEIARRQADAERLGTERAWYDLVLYAAGCGTARKLPYLAKQAIDFSAPGGPVESRLKAALSVAGPRAGTLRNAMIQRNLLDGGPVDPVADAGKGRAPSSATAKKPSGRPLDPPTGKFSPAMKAKLAEAADLEARGAAEYELSGPDNVNRKEHRKAALALLLKARDIYDQALEEDSYSKSLDRHLHDTLEMISHLRKEMNLGD